MWKTVKLGDVAKPVGGSGFPKKYQGITEGEVPFFKVSDMNLPENERYMLSANNYVSRETLKAMKAKSFPTGTVIFPKVGGAISTNKKRILTSEAAFDNNVMGLVPSKDLSPEYLYKIFLNLDLYDLSNKAALPSITASTVKELDIVLPELEEQQRIVAKLDAAFAEIDRAIEIAQQQMQHAHALHQQKTDSVFGEINGDKKTLNDVCHLITCGVAARPEYVEEGIPFLSAQNVKKGQVIYSNHKYITQQKHEELTKKNKPTRGDLLYTRVGSFGEAAVVERDIEFSLFVSLTLIKTKNELNPYYLKHYLNSQRLKTLASKSLSGSGVGNLNVGTVRKFPISLPSIEKQLEVVKSLNDLADSTELLYETCQSKVAQLQSLKSSILTQELNPSETV